MDMQMGHLYMTCGIAQTVANIQMNCRKILTIQVGNTVPIAVPKWIQEVKMTLKYFLEELWSRKNMTVALCDYDDYSRMFADIDEIEIGKVDIENILEYIIWAFQPHLTENRESEYLSEKLMMSEVKAFYINRNFMIIWIKE